MSESNELEKKVPALVVGYDEAAQDVVLQFDTRVFRSWTFVLAVLEMARRKAEVHKRLGEMEQLQAQAADQARAMAIHEQIRRGRGQSD